MASVTHQQEQILPEDQVTNALIQEKFDGFNTEVEARYEHYGERGYADLVVEDTNYLAVIEIKSCPNSANEVIRQFTKMKENFVKGSDYQQRSGVQYYLYFTASDRNYRHIKDNRQMYESLSNQKRVSIWMADEQGNQLQVFSPTEKFDSQEWKESVKDHLNGVDPKEQLICPYCGKEYQMKAYHKKHVKTCTGTPVTKVKS